MALQTVTSAIATDRAMATSGRSVKERAAAGAPIIRLKISSVPTTGTVMVAASATTTRKQSSMAKALTPRASPTSASTEESISARYSATIAATHATASAAVGATWLAEMPSTSPNSSDSISGAYCALKLRNSAPSPSIITSARAVTTSWRPRRPSTPIDSAPSSEKAPSPTSVLIPSRVAPAAPAKEPLGMAWATNAEPRSTVKKPKRAATAAQQSGQARQQVGEEDQRDHEEADRPAGFLGRPVVAVVGQQDAQPHGGDAHQAGDGDGQSRPPGQAQRGGSGADQQRGGEDRADRDRSQRDGEREREQVGGADGAHGDPARGGHLGAHAAEQQRPVQQRDEREHARAEPRDQRQRAHADSEHRAKQDRPAGAGGVVQGAVEVQQQRGQAEGGAEHDPGREVASGRGLDADQLHRRRRHDPGGDEAPQRADAEQERAGPTGDADVAERLAGEGLPAHDRERADRPRHDRDDRTDDDRDAHVFAREEAVREDQGGTHSASSPGSGACRRPGKTPSCPCMSPSSPAPATTSTRPCTLSTSTWLPDSSLKPPARTPSATLPLAARPPAR